MEAGTYLTQITPDKQAQTSFPVKFTRFTFSQAVRQKPESELTKKYDAVNRIFNKNLNNFMSEQYYSVKKVKPGISFHKVILQTEYQRNPQSKIPLLYLNIPETLLFQENSLQMIYSQNGVVKVNSQINFSDFVKLASQNNGKYLYKQHRLIQNRDIFPSVISGVGNGTCCDFSINFSNELDSKILPRNENQISIKYVQPFGKCPNILRLFYVPKSIKGSKPNQAYKAINKKKIDQEVIHRKHKQIHNFIVDFNKNQLITLTLVKGKALAEVQAMTQSIVNYLQYVKQTKITEIVVDFIFGQDRVYYFHEIKSIKSKLLNSIWDVGTQIEMDQKYKQQINQVICRLCGFSFPKVQMTKLVTNKLIVQLLYHLKSRGEKIFCNNLCKGVSLSASSNVCELCYELIVAEHHLINIQQQFSHLTNVSTDQVVRVKQINDMTFPVFCHEEAQMIKWRIFFYIEKIKNVPSQIIGNEEIFNLSIKFSDIKQTFKKKFTKDNDFFFLSRASSAITNKKGTDSRKSHKMQNSRHEKKSTLHTSCTNRSYDNFSKETTVLDFQKIKVITFYTRNKDIRSILQKQPFSFELGYKNLKFKGQSATLQNFTDKKECQRYSCEVLLFDQKFQYCNLQLNVGLICDGVVSTSNLSLSQSEKGSILFHKNCINQACSPLPAQWIELISEGLEPSLQSCSKQQIKPKINTLKRVQSGYIIRQRHKEFVKANSNITEGEQQQQEEQYL